MVHLKDIAKNFNISNFIIYCCLLLLSVLLSLRVDGIISWSFGLVFIPLWIWNLLTFAATAVGVLFWIKEKKLRKDLENRKYFVAMAQSSLLQFFIFLTEILVAINLDQGGRLSWAAIFTPLYLLFFVSIAACVISCCFKTCNIELELLGFINILQLIFLAIRLDDATMWRWVVILIPTWILLIIVGTCIAFYACFQYCLLVSIEENHHDLDVRKLMTTTSIIFFFFSTLSFAIFLGLLVSQLDGNLSAPYTATFIPLHISIISLFPTTFSRQPANPWWFGLRKNFIEFILELCPIFKEYLNISWSKGGGSGTEISTKIKLRSGKKVLGSSSVAHVINDYSYQDIMTPD